MASGVSGKLMPFSARSLAPLGPVWVMADGDPLAIVGGDHPADLAVVEPDRVSGTGAFEGRREGAMDLGGGDDRAVRGALGTLTGRIAAGQDQLIADGQRDRLDDLAAHW